jgi:hypothetical protein
MITTSMRFIRILHQLRDEGERDCFTGLRQIITDSLVDSPLYKCVVLLHTNEGE